MTDERRKEKSISSNNIKNKKPKAKTNKAYTGKYKNTYAYSNGRYKNYPSKKAWDEYKKRYNAEHIAHRITLNRKFEENFLTMFKKIYGFDINLVDYIKENLEKVYIEMSEKND